MAILTALAPVRRTFLKPRTISGTVTQRKSVHDMTAEDVQTFRLALSRIAKLSDDRGFQHIAGIHGLPLPRYCEHRNAKFAIWHRPYMHLLEKALQVCHPQAFLPYWDWNSPAEFGKVPKIYLEESWHNPDSGKKEPNPLLGQPITFPRTRHLKTHRDIGSPSVLKTLPGKIQEALKAADYDAFTNDMESAHNAIHNFINGTMSDPDYAAYDPLFWAHHSNIERYLCQWQDQHHGVPIPPDIDGIALRGLGVTTNQVWSYRALGYEYVPSGTSPLKLSAARTAQLLDGTEVPTVRSGAAVTTFALDRIDRDFHRAEIRLEACTPPTLSFELRVFVNEPRPNARTKTVGNPHYLCSHFFFSHGEECAGDEGHCVPVERDLFDLRPEHHRAPHQLRLNVTKTLRTLLAGKGENLANVTVTLVAVDHKGKEVAEPGLHFDGLTLAAN